MFTFVVGYVPPTPRPCTAGAGHFPTNNLKDWNVCVGIKSRENLRYIEYNQNGSKLKFYETDFVT